MSVVRDQVRGARLAALAREGAARFAQRSRAAAVRDEGQMACAILDGRGRLLAQDQGEPSQLAAVQASVAQMLDAFAYDLAPGDVLLSGDPHRGGTWAGVPVLAVPVFAEGDLAVVAAVRFAVTDLAGELPGPAQPQAHEIWQEGLRLTPLKLTRAGAVQADLHRWLARNTRAPGALAADLAAAEAAAAAVARGVAGLIAAAGVDGFAAAGAARCAAAAARARAVLDRLTLGTGIDGPVRLTVTRRDDGGVLVDATGSDAPDAGAANLTAAGSLGVILAQLFGAILDDAGASQGLLDAVTLRAERTCLAARAPAAVSMGWRALAPALARALAQATGTVPAIAPPGPALVVFPAIGTPGEVAAVTLAPGLDAPEGTAGGCAATGQRRLVSAEEVEAAGLLRLTRRERDGDAVLAEAELLRDGEGIALPHAAAPVILQVAPLTHPRRATLQLQAGARLGFRHEVRG